MPFNTFDNGVNGDNGEKPRHACLSAMSKAPLPSTNETYPNGPLSLPSAADPPTVPVNSDREKRRDEERRGDEETRRRGEEERRVCKHTVG